MRKTKWGVFLVVAFSAALALPGKVAHVQPVHDHFKTYAVVGPYLPTPIDVVLKDQFGEMQGTVEHIGMFSNPVEKMLPGGEVSPINHPDNHLTWYVFTGTSEQRTLLVTNQFGTDQEWVVKNPAFLLLPAQKLSPLVHPPPVDLDHYLCYHALGPSVDLDGVTLTDQFYQQDVTVGGALIFCNPVDKIVPDDGVPIYDNENHLACYGISPHLSPPFSDVIAIDQFCESDSILRENQYLCVPSEKRIKPPPTCMASVAEGIE